MDQNGDVLLDESGNYTLERTNIITEERIIEKIEKLYKDGLKLLKWQEEKRENYTCETYVNLKVRFECLFDILCCRCELGDNPCRNCPLDKQIPDLEVQFINDQRSERNMIISGIDKRGTETYQKRIKRLEEMDNHCRVAVGMGMGIVVILWEFPRGNPMGIPT